MRVDEAGRSRRSGPTVLVVALACALIVTPAASAAEFMVDSTADDTDAALGDESCLTGAGECTLRAAIEEGAGLGEFTRIDFEEETFEGQAAATIELGSSLPPMTVPAFVNGRTCNGEAGSSGPCVGVDGPSGEPALIVSAEEVEIFGLAITGAQTAVVLQGSPRTKVQGSWLGVALDGGLAGNETGVLVGSGSNRSLIGGEGPGLGNVFAGNASDGLAVHGGNNVRVFGNYFGVEPDGSTPAANGDDAIEVVSSEGSEPVGTAIGTRVSSTAATSPACDGGCNVISGAESDGIDLEGDDAGEAAAASTSIAANYVGLDAGGTAVVANADVGIRVGIAAHTLIGGPSSAEANRINGGSVGILAGPAAPDLAIRGNRVGVDETGTVTLTPPEDGIVVDSAELPSPTVEAEIAGNEVRMEDGVAIAQRGEGAWIHDNRILGAETGVRVFESTAGHGNVIERNSIEGSTTGGILLENDLNEVVGNEVVGAGGSGIRIHGSLPFGVSGNLIGGDAPADENLIDGSAGAAIEIANLKATANEVARNRGSGNAGRFIDLVAASAGEETPNGGIAPPVFSSAGQAGASGGAEPGATVRVFRKQSSAVGEIASFLGEATADPGGSWSVVYESAVVGGTMVAVTQTSEAGGTSEIATAVTDGEAAAGGGDGEGGGGSGGEAPAVFGSLARFWPRTKIVKAPRGRVGGSVRFDFESDEPGSRFLCRLDSKPFDLCRSPKRYRGLAPGRHLFEVRAIDSQGHLDPTPAKKRFAVRGRR